MIYRLLIFSLFLTICTCKYVESKSGKNIEVVNPDYGILSVADKTRDGSRPLGWRCFPIKDVQVKYRDWRDADPMGPYDVIVTMCDFEIFTESTIISNEYHGRRAKQVIYCNEFKAAWKKLTQDEKHICLDAEPSIGGIQREGRALKKLIMSWTWDKIKTKKGCYSFWDGFDC